MSGSSTPSPPRVVEVTSSRRPEPAAREKGAGSSLRSVALLVREDQRVTHSHMMLGSPGASEVRRDPPRQDDPPRMPVEHKPSPHHLFDGFDRPNTDSLQRRPSRARSTTPTLTLSVPQGVDTSAVPQRLQSLVIRGGGAPDVHVPLSAGGSQRPTSDAAEVGRTASEPTRERNTTLKPAGRSGPAPESAECRGPPSELVGAKRTTPEQGSLDWH
jgi:hypothetical protein